MYYMLSEVKVQRDGSIITTKRTSSSDCTSNEISVQLLDGGSRVNIQQSQVQSDRKMEKYIHNVRFKNYNISTAPRSRSKDRYKCIY